MTDSFSNVLDRIARVDQCNAGLTPALAEDVLMEMHLGLPHEAELLRHRFTQHANTLHNPTAEECLHHLGLLELEELELSPFSDSGWAMDRLREVLRGKTHFESKLAALSKVAA